MKRGWTKARKNRIFRTWGKKLRGLIFCAKKKRMEVSQKYYKNMDIKMEFLCGDEKNTEASMNRIRK